MKTGKWLMAACMPLRGLALQPVAMAAQVVG